MNPATDVPWVEANHGYLAAALRLVRLRLNHHLAQVTGALAGERLEDAERELAAASEAMPSASALDRLCAAFGLSSFERGILLLSAGVELDGSFAALCAAAQGETARNYATFSLALAAFPDAHWSAITPVAALRHWRMVEVAGPSLTTGAVRISERVLHFLAGAAGCDEQLLGLLEPLALDEEVSPSQQTRAGRIAALWAEEGMSPVVQLTGPDSAGKRAVAAHACSLLGIQLWRLSPQILPSAPGELETLLRLCERETVLGPCAFLVDAEGQEASWGITRLLEHLRGPLFLTTRERPWVLRRPTIHVTIPRLEPAEQQTLWYNALGTAAENLNGQVDQLLGQFSLDAPAIRTASAAALRRQHDEPAGDLGQHLWHVCRVQARPRLDGLAQRIESRAGWDDLVVPEPQRRTLHEIAGQLRQRAKVYQTWGFAGKGGRGLGLSALFAGPSGVGKTLAAEVLANELQLDLYRIDLSQVVSKYIGETEKNLRGVFDAAEEGSAILLFDEADALFGKRSEVKDSHDRYANIEISYLLQRMEAYHGLAILTTNMKNVLDPAFLRRLRFVVNFPFPDVAQRIQIWRRIFPADTPTEGLVCEKLAKLNVTGGNIRNIAMNAAFLAADAGEPVRMAHVLRAAGSEYAKLEKHLSEAEIGGWV